MSAVEGNVDQQFISFELAVLDTNVNTVPLQSIKLVLESPVHLIILCKF